MFKLDHLVFVAPDLECGQDYVADRLGVQVPFGGRHPKMATHNCLMQLGSGEYLEIIAPDPAAEPAEIPRWFGLDAPDIKPRIQTWVLATENIADSLAGAPPDAGVATPMTRSDYHWQISLPKAGKMPLNGAFPALIQWSSHHPAAHMPDLSCALVSLSIQHPEIAVVSRFLQGRLSDARIDLKYGAEIHFEALFDTPYGQRAL